MPCRVPGGLRIKSPLSWFSKTLKILAIRTISEYIRHYSSQRPHQGIKQKIPDNSSYFGNGQILKKPVLNCLHYYYYPKAVQKAADIDILGDGPLFISGKEKVIELVLLVKPDNYSYAESEESPKDESADMLPSEAKIKEVKEMAKSAEKTMTRQKSARVSKTIDYISTETKRSNHVSERIKKLIHRFKGRIIKEDYDKKSNLLTFITFEIPAKDYILFLTNLNNIGQLQKPIPASFTSTERLIRNRIKLLSEVKDVEQK